MILRILLSTLSVVTASVFQNGPYAAERPTGPAFAPRTEIRGHAQIAPGVPLSRSQTKQTRPRAEAFVPGQVHSQSLVAARVQQPFRFVKDSVNTANRMEIVFLAKQRPVHLQLVISTSGKSVTDRWVEHFRKLFEAFDRDQDGVLNRYEIDFIFPIAGVKQLFQGGYYFSPGNVTPTLATTDRDGDNRVSFDEFLFYYSEAISDLVKHRPIPGQGAGQDVLTQELFARLDLNKDSKLSQAELRAAEKILLQLDSDEDECVSSQELLANPTRTATPLLAVPAPTAMAAPNRQPVPVPTNLDLNVFSSQIPGQFIQRLMARYDKNSDLELSPSEIGFDKQLFTRLDRNQNGKLSATELDEWRTMPADGTVHLLLGDKPEECRATAQPIGANWPSDVTVRQTLPNRLVIRVGTQTIEFGVSTPPEMTRQQQNQQFFANIFPQGKMEILESELAGPQNQFLRVIFDEADFDSDGKLTRTEFEKYFKLQRATSELGMSLTSVVRTPNFFQNLDENLDNKLGVRELRTAWDRMFILEPVGSNEVTKSILQPNATFQLSPTAFAYFDSSIYQSMGAARTDPSVQKGPVWFRKMDRNADGDISRSEFLGVAADFQKLDLNTDQLISLEEAEAFEAIMRPQPAKPQNKGANTPKK